MATKKKYREKGQARRAHTPGQRKLAVELVARGNYNTSYSLCEIAGYVGYRSCARFKNDVIKAKRRIAATKDKGKKYKELYWP